MIRRLALLLVAFCLVLPAAHAHERSRSTSSWVVTDDQVHSVFLLDARQATLFLGLFPDGTSLEAAFRTRLIDGLGVSRGGQACEIASVPDTSASSSVAGARSARMSATGRPCP